MGRQRAPGTRGGALYRKLTGILSPVGVGGRLQGHRSQCLQKGAKGLKSELRTHVSGSAGLPTGALSRLGRSKPWGAPWPPARQSRAPAPTCCTPGLASDTAQSTCVSVRAGCCQAPRAPSPQEDATLVAGHPPPPPPACQLPTGKPSLPAFFPGSLRMPACPPAAQSQTSVSSTR